MAKPLEQAVAIAFTTGSLAGHSLDGIYLGADGEGSAAHGGAVVAPPHPLHGGCMGSPVVNELAWACRKAGIASLRFDWRGVGGSAGSPSGSAAHADEDFACALAYMEESVHGGIVACGYSFGAAAAARAARRSARVRGLLLVAPPPSLLDFAALHGFDGTVLVVSGEADRLAPPAELEALLAQTPRARLERIPDTDHFFASGLGELGRIAARWLARGGAARV